MSFITPPTTPMPQTGLKGLKASIQATRALFSDFEITVLDQVAEGPRVATRWRATMTPGDAGSPTGDSCGSVSLAGITIERFADGKVVESWRTVNGVPAAGPRSRHR
jgi:predicted ester cyclase